MPIAILINCFNRIEKTLSCLESISKFNFGSDIYLVDEGYTDGTSKAVIKYFSKLYVIKKW